MSTSDFTDYRILNRSGPGDSFKVVQRRVPAYDEYDALKSIEVPSGQYLVQNRATHHARLFRVKPNPTFLEL